MAITKIQSESLNLADDFAFTGTITGAGGVNTPYICITRSSGQNISNNTQTKIELNTKLFDSEGSFDSTTNYRWTPQTSGKYFITFKMLTDSSFVSTQTNAISYIYKNGSEVAQSKAITDTRNNGGVGYTNVITEIISLNGSTDYLEFYGKVTNGSGTPVIRSETLVTGFKVIE